MIILEGIDGAGKTTVADYLNQNGYSTYHFTYDKKNKNIEDKYINLLDEETQNMVLDRSFVSELVYGPVLRHSCKLNREQLEKILTRYKQVNPIVLYFKANKEDILQRRIKDEKDYQMLTINYDALNNRYEKVIRVISKYLNVIEINTSERSVEEVLSLVEEKINENNVCRECIER